MIARDACVHVTQDVRLHVLDDGTGFLETSREVRRVKGSGLGVMATRLLPRLRTPTRVSQLYEDFAAELPGEQIATLLEGLAAQGVLAAAPEDPPCRGVALYGPPLLTDQLAGVLGPQPGVRVDRGGPVPPPGDSRDLAVVATASLFDPVVAAACADLVRRGRPHLVWGLTQGGSAFVTPLWEPDDLAACFTCLRTRVLSHAVNAATLQAYVRLLASTGGTPVAHTAPAWRVARPAAAAARRALAWSTAAAGPPDQELLWFDDSDEPGRRRLLAVPTCACADRPGAAPPRRAGTLDAAEDPLVGIVHATSVRQAETGPAIYLGGSTSADFSVVRPGMRVTRNGGAGFTRADAVNATLGEALERYAAGIYRRTELRLASWRQLAADGEDAVEPGRFGLFSPAQYAEDGFPFEPFTADTQIRWVRAERVGRDGGAWVPASQTYLYYRRAPGEAAVAPSISTGLAAAPTRTEATLSGLYEILERDALAVSWLYRLPPRPVPPAAVAASPAVTRHLREARSWRVRFFDLSLDVAVPVVAAVMEHRGAHGSVLSFGSACRASVTQAVEKAFLEAAQGQTYVRRLLRQHPDWRAAPDFANVSDFNLHAILYTRHPELRAAAGYLVHPTAPAECLRTPGEGAVSPDGDAATQLEQVAAAVRALGYDVFSVDLTTPDVRQLGVRVVRVVVPGLQHLAGSHRLRYLGSRRLADVADRLHLASPPDNPFPHPLP